MENKIKTKRESKIFLILIIITSILISIPVISSSFDVGIEGVIGLDLIPESSTSSSLWASLTDYNTTQFDDGDGDTLNILESWISSVSGGSVADGSINSSSFNRSGTDIIQHYPEDNMCVGLNCLDPNVKFSVNSSTVNTIAHFRSEDANGFIRISDDLENVSVGIYGDDAVISNANSVGAAQHLSITTDGEVKIATTEETGYLNIAGLSNKIGLVVKGGGGNSQAFRVYQNAPTSNANGRAFTIGQVGKVYTIIGYYTNSFYGAGDGDSDRDTYFGRSGVKTFRIGNNYDGTGNANLIVNQNMSIGTTAIDYPLHVVGNYSAQGISIFSDGNVSASDYITRTSIWNKDWGSVWDFIKDSEELKTEGKINHERMSPNVINHNAKVQNGSIIEFYEVGNESDVIGYYDLTLEDGSISQAPIYGSNITLNRSVPTFEDVEFEGISVSDMLAKHEQALFELHEENKLLKSTLCEMGRLEWCL